MSYSILRKPKGIFWPRDCLRTFGQKALCRICKGEHLRRKTAELMTQLSLFLIAHFIIAFLALNAAQPADRVAFEFIRTPTSCDHECTHGACAFKDCSGGQDSDFEPPSCPGGACRFENCKNPVCSGGGCEFVNCVGGTCDGGGCDFINPRSTLKDGYCEGESCKLDGKDHPNFRHFLTV